MESGKGKTFSTDFFHARRGLNRVLLRAEADRKKTLGGRISKAGVNNVLREISECRRVATMKIDAYAVLLSIAN